MNFHEFPRPAEIDGLQLKDELKCQDVYFREDILVISGELSYDQASAGLKAHKPKPKIEPTLEDKLSMVGLSVADLKAALGL
jgi:hypothetical protein